jgi:hypothetical protein
MTSALWAILPLGLQRGYECFGAASILCKFLLDVRYLIHFHVFELLLSW